MREIIVRTTDKLFDTVQEFKLDYKNHTYIIHEGKVREVNKDNFEEFYYEESFSDKPWECFLKCLESLPEVTQ